MLIHDLDKNVHRPAANHSFFTRLISREREVVQFGCTRAQGLFCLRPDLGLDAAAADSSSNFAVLKEKHFGATLLRRRAACVRDGGDHDTLATFGSFTDHAIEVALWNGRHLVLCVWNFVLCITC